MRFRRQFNHEQVALQLAPMIDVIMFLLVFFLLTWNIARYETELDIKVPKASASKESHSPFDTVVINVRKDGVIILNKQQKSPKELLEVLTGLVKQFPNQAVIIRADEQTEYKFIVEALNMCREADIWNVAFATEPPPKN
ncbi:MAG: biopolymer transporter ExbD [Verrucomicrobiota bacterium]|nr:biopolymer transporter ExbD [Verrucomicrobiota bacterium]